MLEEIGGNEVHLRAANRLLHLCQKNGGVYIKIGQHLVGQIVSYSLFVGLFRPSSLAFFAAP